jgi:DNA invertase Pin-like site-specific DNA recombinase
MIKIFGYARVSSEDQNSNRQIRTLKKYVNSEKDIFIDKKSSKDTERINFQQLREIVKSGDIIVCTELDGFARSKQEIKNELVHFKSKGVKVVFVDIPTTKMFLGENKSLNQIDDIFDIINNILIEVITTMTEKERKKNRERQLQGIKAAKENGVQFGRPKKIDLNDTSQKNEILNLIEKIENNEMTNKEAGERLNISTRYFYTIKNKVKNKRQ